VSALVLSDYSLLKVICILGKVVSLSSDRWQHVLSHPELKNQRTRIKETLAAPDEIRASAQNPEIWLFYRLYPKTPVTTKYMLVVVKVSNEEGFIVTAFYTDKVKKGDIIWKKSQ
jgi:hypothetical protein